MSAVSAGGSARTEPGVFAGIAGNAGPLRLLESQLQTGRLSHAYLFAGESGLGKLSVARRFAQALLPETLLRRHPDYWEDCREDSLKIDEIRLLPDRQPEFHEQSLQAFLSRTPAIAGRRVAVIANVGRLRDQTQGILLKTLEEPHPNRVIILTTPSISPFVVLPTVVSRCQRVAFHPALESEVRGALLASGVEPELAAVLAGLARGRPGWALGAAAEPEVVARHVAAVEALETVFGAPADVPLRLAAQYDSAPSATAVLGSWQLRIRESMLSEPVPGPWARLLEQSFETLGHLEQNVSPRLALECFLLACRRVS